MIKTRGVNHIAIRISDVARSSEFYGKLLGLEVVPFPTMDREKAAKFREEVVSSKRVPGPTGGIWFAAGSTQLHLIASPGIRNAPAAPSDLIWRWRWKISMRLGVRSRKPASSSSRRPLNRAGAGKCGFGS